MCVRAILLIGAAAVTLSLGSGIAIAQEEDRPDPRIELLDRLIKELPKFLPAAEAKAAVKKLKRARKEWLSLTPEQRKEKLSEASKLEEKVERGKDNKKRWDKLTPAEKKKYGELNRELEKALKGKTEEERRRIMEGLRRLEYLRSILTKFKKELPRALQKKIEKLTQVRREGLLWHAMGLLRDYMRERFMKSLSEKDRKRIGKLSERDRYRELYRLKMKQALESLPEKERKAIEEKPEKERKRMIYHLMRKHHAVEKDRVKEDVVKELTRLLALDPKKLDKILRKSRPSRRPGKGPGHRPHRLGR